MRAEIVSVGTEILLGQIADTNAVELGRAFAACGIDHTNRQTVGDNLERLTVALKLALSRSDIVVTIGGLGPTEDDLTRDGIAAALDDPLIHDDEIEHWLRSIMEKRRYPWVDSQLRQAKRPSCGRVVPNPNGTAPGLVCERDGKTVIAMPGPKGEFVPMLESQIKPLLAEKGGGQMIVSRTIKVVGIGESLVEKKLSDLMQASDPTVAPYAKTGEVHLRVTTKCVRQDEADEKFRPVVDEIRRRLGNHFLGFEDDTLESVLIDLLVEGEETIATAESCTGGMVGQRITGVPGSSAAYLGGVVSYANDVKAKLLGVSNETLEAHGAVSAACAEEMAAGAARALGSTYAVSVTGIAGPTGGTPEKPVGLFYVGVATPEGVEAHRFSFPGIRETVRVRATQMALYLAREAVLRRRAGG